MARIAQFGRKGPRRDRLLVNPRTLRLIGTPVVEFERLQSPGPAEPIAFLSFKSQSLGRNLGWGYFSCASVGEWPPLRSCSLQLNSVAIFADEVEWHEPEIDMFASMTGKCSTLKVAERDFSCTTVAFSHSPAA